MVNEHTQGLHSSSFCGSSLESYKVIPKRNYYGAYGYGLPEIKPQQSKLSPFAEGLGLRKSEHQNCEREFYHMWEAKMLPASGNDKL